MFRFSWLPELFLMLNLPQRILLLQQLRKLLLF
jgi:hypothetical protein